MIQIAFGPLQVICALLPAIIAAAGTVLLGVFRPGALRQTLRVVWRVKLALLTLGGLTAAGVLLVPRLLYPTPLTHTESAARSEDWPLFRGGPQRTGSTRDAVPIESGEMKWLAKEPRTVYSSCAIAGGRVYLTTAEKGPFRDRGSIFCLDGDTGEVLWQSAPQRMRATFSSPALSGKYLVCGEGLHDTQRGRVICLDIEQHGNLIWQFETQSHVESSPCIAGNRVFVGAGDDGYYCLSLTQTQAHSRVVWHAPGDQYPDTETSPVILNGRMYAGLGEDGNAVICLDAATGRGVWRIPTPYPVFASPSVLNGNLYVAMGNGTYVQSASELADQKLSAWRKAGKSDAQLAELAQQLAEGGEVWCIDMKAATQKSRDAQGEQIISATNPDIVRWRFKLPATVLGAVAADRDELYFASRSGHVYCLATDGKERSRWAAEEPILSSVAVTKEQVFAVTASGRLCALQRSSLELLWETRLGSSGPFLSSPAVSSGHIYVGSQRQGMMCIGKPGTVAAATNEPWKTWIEGSDSAIGAPVYYHQIGVVALQRPSSLVAFDRPTGQILWNRNHAAVSPPLLNKDTVQLCTAKGTITIRLLDGEEIGFTP